MTPKQIVDGAVYTDVTPWLLGVEEGVDLWMGDSFAHSCKKAGA